MHMQEKMFRDPQVMTLETIQLLEAASTALFGALRRTALEPAGRDAGAAEYDSWFANGQAGATEYDSWFSRSR